MGVHAMTNHEELIDFTASLDWKRPFFHERKDMLKIALFSIYQISGLQFSRVFICSRNLEYLWIFTVLRTERKMARHFAKVSEEEIVATNEAAFSYPSDLVNTKTTIPSRSVKSGGYIPPRFASRYISTTIHLPFGG